MFCLKKFFREYKTKYYNYTGCKCFVYVLSHLFLSSCQIHQNLPFLNIYIYIYMCVDR